MPRVLIGLCAAIFAMALSYSTASTHSLARANALGRPGDAAGRSEQARYG